MFEREKQFRWSKIKVSLVITAAVFVVVLSALFAGNIKELFLPKAELKVQFRDIAGLRNGAPVWILGVEEGSVKSIDLSPEFGVLVTLSINKSAFGLIRKDSHATINTLGLLGDKYVELSTGSAEAEPVKPGGTLVGELQTGMRDFARTTSLTAEKITEFVSKMEVLVMSLQQGRGTLAKLINDPAVYDNLKKSTESIATLTEEMKRSKGTLHKFIEDPSLYDRMTAAVKELQEFSERANRSTGTLKKLLEDPALYDRALTTVTELERFSETVNRSSGTLKKLLEDPSLYDKTLATVRELEQFSTSINRGSGSLKKLIEDPALYEKMLAAVSDLQEVSRKVREGKGTLGRLLEDPEAYENLNRSLKELSSILDKIDRGQGIAGALISNQEMARELEETILELKKLIKDMTDQPKKYFRFSLF